MAQIHVGTCVSDTKNFIIFSRQMMIGKFITKKVKINFLCNTKFYYSNNHDIT